MTPQKIYQHLENNRQLTLISDSAFFIEKRYFFQCFSLKNKKVTQKVKTLRGKTQSVFLKEHFPQADETTGWIKVTQQEVNNE